MQPKMSEVWGDPADPTTWIKIESDVNGDGMSVSHFGYRLHDYTKDEILGKRFVRIHPPPARDDDPTPIDADWIVACGGAWNSDDECVFCGFVVSPESKWWIETTDGDRIGVVTRGQFRRAADLLGVTLNESDR